MSLENKVALVTGASRGIGQAIAFRLGQQGATVIGTATTEAGADKITEALKAKNIKGRGLALNVTEKESILATVDAIVKEFDSLDILVNNAGITRDNLLLRMKDDEWNSIIETNLTPIFHLCKTVIRKMIKARWGRIINISSLTAFSGNPGQTNYAAAKAGLVGFTKSLAHEVASRNVTVNVVAPGFIETDMTKGIAEEHTELVNKQIAMGRMGQPEEIAAAVGFLASMEASYITGETLHVNGGMYMA